MSSIGHICEMIDEGAPLAQRLEVGDRARFTGDDLRDEGDACREIIGRIEGIASGCAALRDDDGNLWSVALEWLESTGDEA